MRTFPWCELFVDGRAIGRTPQSLVVEPGRHELRCANPSGERLERSVEVAPGTDAVIEERLSSTVALLPRLARGDAIEVEGHGRSAGAVQLRSGRQKLRLYRGTALVEERWIDVPPGGCRLSDTPELHCEGP